MPEGPEVAYLAERLSSDLVGRPLTAVRILNGRYAKHGPPAGYAAFVRALPLRLTAVESTGKVLFFRFENDWTLISKLGLTGWWYVGAKPAWLSDYKNVAFTFGGAPAAVFADQLSFGTLTFARGADAATEQRALAPDILSPQTTWPRFRDRLAAATLAAKTIEEVLADQRLVLSGIGNYLKAEILYAARIAPMTAAADLTPAQWRALFDAAKRVTRRMLRALRADADATESAYDAALKIYGKRHDPHGNAVETYKNKTNRTTYWVPAVQTGASAGAAA